MISNRQKDEAYAGLLARAWVDPDFRKEFLTDPWGFLANQGLHDEKGKAKGSMPKLTTDNRSMFDGLSSCKMNGPRRSLMADVLSPVP